MLTELPGPYIIYSMYRKLKLHEQNRYVGDVDRYSDLSQ